MTIPMPEPVAFAAGGHPNHLCSRAQYNSMLGKNRIKFDVPLITTTQAEAYADARVREALEEAATIIEKNALDCIPTTAVILLSQAQAIRALLPSTIEDEDPIETINHVLPIRVR